MERRIDMKDRKGSLPEISDQTITLTLRLQTWVTWWVIQGRERIKSRFGNEDSELLWGTGSLRDIWADPQGRWTCGSEAQGRELAMMQTQEPQAEGETASA